MPTWIEIWRVERPFQADVCIGAADWRPTEAMDWWWRRWADTF